MANFLSALLSGASRQPSLTPEWFAGVMNGPQPEALQIPQTPSEPVNILEGLGYQQPAPQMAGGTQDAAAPQPTRAPRERRTVLDTVGRIADALAKAGGASPLYQPTLDAREDRRFALEDRQRGIDLEALKMALTRQQMQAGAQQLETGQNELTDYSTEKVGLGVRGLQAIQKRGGDPVKAWPLIAQQLGIAPERAAIIGDAIQKDPDTLFGLYSALNAQKNEFGLQPFYTQDANGNIQAYQLGKDGSIRPVDLPEGQTPAGQTAVMDTGGANIVYDKRTGRSVRVTPKSGGPVAGENPIVDAQGRVIGYAPVQGSDLEFKRGQKQGQGVSRLNPTQRGAVAQTLESVPSIRATLDRVDALGNAMQKDGSYARGYVGGLAPGQLVGGKAAEFDKSAALLAAQIRTLIRTAGEGSMSDFESRLALLPLPSRQDSDEGRAEAIRGLRTLLKEVEGRSKRLLAPPTASPRPRQAQGATQPVTAPQRRQAGTNRAGKPSVSNW